MPKIIPFGERILVKRRKVGDKIGVGGILYAPDQVSEHDTDLADVVYVPDNSFTDEEIIANAPEMIKALTAKSNSGDSAALESLFKLNDFLVKKSIKVGDRVFMSKYVGTDFMTSDSKEQLTLVNLNDIIGLVVKE